MFAGQGKKQFRKDMDISIIKDLLDKYLAGRANLAEQQLVEQWLEETELRENEWDKMNAEDKSAWINNLQDELKKNIDGSTVPFKYEGFIPAPWYSRRYFHVAAAAIIIMAAVGSWYFLLNKDGAPEKIVAARQAQNNDVLPGTNKAVLTLANGDTVILDNADNGVIARQGNTEISKKGSQLVYNKGQMTNEDKAHAYHMLTTPRGGQYSLILPDGSLVWLNAASSIRYPVTFADDIREVEITGEAYFEVALRLRAGKKVPFHVNINSPDGVRKSRIEVLGTHFNINAYNEEASINTTLLEGKVRVILPGDDANEKKPIVLSPGQQARLNAKGEIKIVNNVDIEEAIAWKNGLFLMTSVDIPVVLRQLARWYDVEIVYKGGKPGGTITGDIPMQMKLSEVLKVLELSGVKYRIEGKKIVVGPGM
ncbi:MAG TPA: FecR domain-containing protein [Chryseolinea sp.]|nr:FecR domain-containing protein [Chryseolinea sp.]